MKPLKESLLRGRDVLSATMADSGREEGFGEVGRLLGRKIFGCLNEIIAGSVTVGYVKIICNVNCSFVSDLGSLCRGYCGSRADSLVPRIRVNLSH